MQPIFSPKFFWMMKIKLMIDREFVMIKIYLQEDWLTHIEETFVLMIIMA